MTTPPIMPLEEVKAELLALFNHPDLHRSEKRVIAHALHHLEAGKRDTEEGPVCILVDFDQQPLIQVEYCNTREVGERVVAISVGLTERGKIVSSGCDENNVPTVCIADDGGVPMEFSFPKYRGWDVWCVEYVNRLLCVCFVKDN